MEFNEEFDVRVDAAPKRVYPTILPGRYVCEIVGEETKSTKAGTGHYLELVFQIHGGQFSGEKLFDRLNLKNPSERASAIARETLQHICNAAGIARPKSSEELLDRHVGVVVENESYNGKIYARIKSYHAVNNSAPKKVKADDGLDGMPF